MGVEKSSHAAAAAVADRALTPLSWLTLQDAPFIVPRWYPTMWGAPFCGKAHTSLGWVIPIDAFQQSLTEAR